MGVKLGLSHRKKNDDFREVLGKIFGPKWDEAPRHWR